MPIVGAWGRPLGKVGQVYLDITLQTEIAAVRFFGEAADVENRTEAFFLSVSGAADPLNADASEGSVWEKRDLKRLLKNSRFDCLWDNPRIVNYYFDAEDKIRGLGALGPLGSAAAIEFACVADPGVRAILYATPAFPCSVELATERTRCDEIAASLESFNPGELR
jgi:hypothetical protein